MRAGFAECRIQSRFRGGTAGAGCFFQHPIGGGRTMYNYFALFLVSVIGIVVLDDDPTGVSAQEWIFFAIMIYSAISFFRLYKKHVAEHYGEGG